jgi:predicted nucleic acid-binding protein
VLSQTLDRNTNWQSLTISVMRKLELTSTNSRTTFVLPETSAFDAAFRLVQRYHDQPIALADALVAVISQQLASPVWTYDCHFDVMQIERWR